MDKRLKNIIDIEKTIAKIKKDFYSYLTDKSITLEERWSNFIKYSDYLTIDTSSSCDDIGVFELCSIYNPPDRYRTYYYSEIVEWLENILILDSHSSYNINTHAFKCCQRNLETINIIYDPKEDVSVWNEKVSTYLNIIKEEILDNGSPCFYYDW